MSVLLEVIATTVADARAAAQAGADRLELVTAMGEGGLTPSVGLIEAVVSAVGVRAAGVPVNVIVRPHSRAFVYDADDYAVMLRDIRAVKAAGANGIVIGMLDAERAIDREGLARACEAADGLAITFHRAFDEARDLREALDVLLGFEAVTNVLTSGGQPSVLRAQATIGELLRQAAGSHCTVLAGAGLTVDAVAEFVSKTHVEAVHFGSGVRVNGNGLAPVDPAKVMQVRALLDAMQR
ncbi:copper homeostasis protein [Paraburkholderia sp. Clong3]|uniref:copper homeostasis protein CutC n=1 Tax=unclassified Paraburkholderia TaxID=2615204 RepID=UPI00161D887C|nr:MULTISPECIES: copper homeostasis protein CutC [unclassified Paraburkholderia]MBB5411016.1 copper homeostasis protein [Paraburkholderia sp. HC6.4b]MBB5455132.1 copper homeostasis protein [Paraburkholderia sp. Kb1A]MBB5458785.1 copper homeostasis protein [Paraburkholderia sp. Cpub6]